MCGHTLLFVFHFKTNCGFNSFDANKATVEIRANLLKNEML